MKQSITIEITVPDGYELTGEFRIPVPGDLYLTPGGSVIFQVNTGYFEKRFIVKGVFVWPDWLKAYCITKDENGDWFAYSDDCSISDDFSIYVNSWVSQGVYVRLDPDILDISLPDVYWKSSKIINPKYKT
jgi:hypothetical protein